MAATTGGKGKLKLGEILVESGVLTRDNLQKALDQQKWEKKPLGDVLVSLNFITEEKLLETLSWQLKTPAIKLTDRTVDRALISLLPEEMPELKRVLPVARDKNKLTVAMADPSDLGLIEDIRFLTNCDVKPVLAAASSIVSAIQKIRDDQPLDDRHKSNLLAQNFDVHQSTVIFSEDGSTRLVGDTPAKPETPAKARADQPLKAAPVSEAPVLVEDDEESLLKLERLLQFMLKRNASYLHLTTDAAPALRLSGQFVRIKADSFTAAELELYAREFLDAAQMEKLQTKGAVEVITAFEDIGRFNLSFFRQSGFLAVTARHIQEFVPALVDLGIPPVVTRMLEKSAGLILVAAAPGQGKSSTLAAMVDYLNRERLLNILLVVQEVRYVFKHHKSNVNIREIGLDTPSISDALQYIGRLDIDVAVVDAITSRDDLLAVLNAAEKGRLIVAAVEADSVQNMIERIYTLLQSAELRKAAFQLSNHVLFLMAQRLIHRADASGNILALEMLTINDAVRPHIREANYPKIQEILTAAAEEGTISLDRYLGELYRRNIISQEMAVAHSKATLSKYPV